MTTVQICIASVQRPLPTITTIDPSGHPIANLFKFRDSNNLYTTPWKFTSDEFRRNFFPSNRFTLLRTNTRITTLSNYHEKNDRWNDVNYPAFNVYNYVLENWNNDIPISNWNVDAQIAIRRDLMQLNDLKHWYSQSSSYTWNELLRVFDKKEENDDNIAGNTIKTRQNSARLKKGDKPIIGIVYTNGNTKIKPIELKIHFEII